MEWSDLKDRFEPLNQHVSLAPDKKQQIRARLHAEIHQLSEQPQVTRSRRRHRRVVTAGSLGAALVAVLCIAAVIDYSFQHRGTHGGSVATGPMKTSDTTGSTASSSSASGSSTQSGQSDSQAGPAQSLAIQSTNSTSNGVAGAVQLVSPTVELNPDAPLQMYGNFGWMLGTTGLYHTTDGGKHWTKVNIPLSSKPSNQVVTTLNGAEARVAVGILSQNHASIHFFRTEDGGNTWQQTQLTESLPGQSGGQLPAFMTFSGAKDGWLTTNVPQFGMGGVAPGGLYRTTDGAESWQRVVPTGFPKGTVPFNWLSFVTPQVGFTSGAPQANADAGVTTGQYRLYRTTDGGNTWAEANINEPKAKRLSILEPQFTGSIGYLPEVVESANGSVQLEVYKSTDFGATWSLLHSFQAQHGGQGPALSVNPESTWVAYDGALWVSTDGGKSFSQIANVPGRITELDMANAQSGYAVTVKPLAGTAGQTHLVYQTKDGGKTWTKVSQQP